MLLIKALIMFTIGLAPQVDPATQDDGTPHVAQATVVVTTCGDTPGQQVITNKPCNEGPGEATCQVILRSGDSNDVRIGCATYPLFAKNIEAGGPWLGIQFGPVPKPLAAHLGIESGQMVLNILEGSPADVAGLQQYDVITGMNGQPVPSNIGEFLDQVRALTPGQSQVFDVISKGREMPVTMVVGRRPEMTSMPKYKFDVLEELAQDNEFFRGGLLHKDAGGDWRFDHFGALGEGGPTMLLKSLPDGENIEDIFNWVGDLPGNQKTQCRVEIKDGNTEMISITREDDKIIVTRTKTDEQGAKTEDTTTYASDDELKQADPDAYDILNGTCNQFYMSDAASGPNAPFIWRSASPDGEDAQPFQIHIQKMIEDASKASGDAKEAHEKAIMLLKDSLGDKDGVCGLSGFYMTGKARISFETKGDGEIRVTTRNGDDELVEVFSNLDELKAKRPELAEKFELLQAASPTAKLK